MTIPFERDPLRTRLVEEGPSWYPPLGDCPCGHGSIRMVTLDGSIEFFECGLKSGVEGACHRRFYHQGTGDAGQLLCGSEGDGKQYDFGAIVEEKGGRYFQSHLSEGDLS